MMFAWVSRKNGYGNYELGTANNTCVSGKSVASIRSKAAKYIGVCGGKVEGYYSEDCKYRDIPDFIINF